MSPEPPCDQLVIDSGYGQGSAAASINNNESSVVYAVLVSLVVLTEFMILPLPNDNKAALCCDCSTQFASMNHTPTPCDMSRQNSFL
jgi:hypothetical protein